MESINHDRNYKHKLSIIVPVYNTVEYIDECLSSIIENKKISKEIICVDDGSTDGGLEVLRGYKNKYSFVKLIEQKNLGPGIARNKALEIAEGEYIGFLDSDDIAHPSMYNQLYESAKKHTADIAISAIEKFSENKQRFARCSYKYNLGYEFNDKKFTWIDIKDKLFSLRFVCWNKIYKREFLDNINARFTEKTFYEDLEFYVKTMVQAGSICYINRELVYNRRFRSGATTFIQGDRVKGIFTALNNIDSFVYDRKDTIKLVKPYEAFVATKLIEYLHKNDKKNIESYYLSLQNRIKKIDIGGNPFIKNNIRKSLALAKKESLLGYLIKEYYITKSELAKQKRLARDYKYIYKSFSKKMRNKNIIFRIMIGGVEKLYKHSIGKYLIYKKSKELVRLVENKNKLVEKRIKANVKAGNNLRVGFFVSDRTKWNFQRLWEILSNDDKFEPRIVLFPQYKNISGSSESQFYNQEHVFFKNIDSQLISMFETEVGVIRDIGDIKGKFDIIFYQHPWGMKGLPKLMLGDALGAYMHYGYIVTDNPAVHYHIPGFHSYLWRYLCQNKIHQRKYIKNHPDEASKAIIVGYPKLDSANLVDRNKIKDNFNIIYAPHHSVGKDNKFRLATFDWSSIPMKNLALKYNDNSWVYKPHSNLKFALDNTGLLTPEDYDEYVRFWRSLRNGVVEEGGNYLDIFANSELMITDCGSFLAEYLYFDKPLIRLISRNQPVRLNDIGERINNVYYSASTADELYRLYEMIVVKKEDPLVRERRKLRDELFGTNISSSDLIYNDLKSLLSS